MKIAFLMVRYDEHVRSPVTTQVIDLLAEWGAEVDILHAEEQMVAMNDIRVEHDLYILKSRTEMALGYAGALHAAGANILNPYPVSALIRDKIALNAVLVAAGVPVPEAFITARPSELAPLLAGGPLVVKPHRGTGTRGVHTIWDPEDLDDVPSNQGPIFAQRLVDRRGTERKIYCIGGQIYGVRRSWPARTYEEKCGQAFTVSPALHQITHRCAKALGIDVFALDVLGDEHKPYVVDVKSFPTFTGVPDAALRVADCIFGAALEAVQSRRDPIAVLGRPA